MHVEHVIEPLQSLLNWPFQNFVAEPSGTGQLVGQSPRNQKVFGI